MIYLSNRYFVQTCYPERSEGSYTQGMNADKYNGNLST